MNSFSTQTARRTVRHNQCLHSPLRRNFRVSVSRRDEKDRDAPTGLKITRTSETSFPPRSEQFRRDPGTTFSRPPSFAGQPRRPPSRPYENAPPRGPRLVLSPEIKARLEAQRKARGRAAAGAPGMMRAVGRRVGPDGQMGDGSRDRRTRRPRRNEGEDDDQGGNFSGDMNQIVYDKFKPPDRVIKVHEPVDVKIEDLREDWPAIPSGGEAMVDGVVNKMRWMARRMQGGYDTPQQTAERMSDGDFIGFENEVEKDLVLEAFKDRTVAKANRLTEKKGVTVAPENPGFQAISEHERKQLAAELIRGEYPQAKKHAFPFMTEVDRMLNNNETYSGKQKTQLMETIEALLPERRKTQAGPARAS